VKTHIHFLKFIINIYLFILWIIFVNKSINLKENLIE